VPGDKLADQFSTTTQLTFSEQGKTDVPKQRNALKLFADQNGIGVDTVYDIKSQLNKGSGSISQYVQFVNYDPFQKTSDYQQIL